MPETLSRRARIFGLAGSIALNAGVIAYLLYTGDVQSPPLQVAEAMAMVDLPPLPPTPPAPTPPQKPLAPRAVESEPRKLKAAAALPAVPAPPAESAQPTTATSVPRSYFGELEALIQRNMVYPPGSIAKGEEGICVVRVSFGRDGVIGSAELVQDAGHGALDEECRAVFRRIGRFPPVPRETSPNAVGFSIELPINYSLQ